MSTTQEEVLNNEAELVSELESWDALTEQLEAKINILTNQGKKKVSLIAPREQDLRDLVATIEEPKPPKKKIKLAGDSGKKELQEVEDLQDPEFNKQVAEYSLMQTYAMLDLGLKVRPNGATFLERVEFYKRLPTPVVGILVGAIQMLMLHQIPPDNFDEIVASI